MNNALKAILDTINNAYKNGECRINEDLERGERGDTLADFISIEVAEACQGNAEEGMVGIAINSLSRALEQLQDVIGALESMDESEVENDSENEDEVAGHTVSWHVDNYADVDNDEIKVITELDDSSIEHLTEKLADGYREGELCISHFPDDNENAEPVELRGWWKKV